MRAAWYLLQFGTRPIICYLFLRQKFDYYTIADCNVGLIIVMKIRDFVTPSNVIRTDSIYIKLKDFR